jgi:DNA-binding beta-propeller fold protein YncE
MLFVTFHGGKPGKHKLLNNIHAYDKGGKLVTQSILDDTPGIVLDELRAIHLRGKLLYVVNANQTQNSVLCYKGKGKKYSYVSTLASRGNCPGILHPFDLTFDDAGFCYLSSQDTNVVTRLKVSKDGRTGTPAPVAPALPTNGKFLPGTFVASSVGTLSTPGTTAVAAPAGLAFSGAGAKKHSVRGVLWVRGALYVVDQPAGRVKVYDANGKLVGQSNKVKQPVHLHHHKGRLYVTGGNQVLTAKIPNKARDFILKPLSGLKMKNAGGLVFTGSGQLYVASRTGNVISKFDKKLAPMVFGSALPDNPEFLLHVK